MLSSSVDLIALVEVDEKSDRMVKTEEEKTEELIKWVAVNDAGSMYVLGHHYYQGEKGLL